MKHLKILITIDNFVEFQLGEPNVEFGHRNVSSKLRMKLGIKSKLGIKLNIKLGNYDSSFQREMYIYTNFWPLAEYLKK
jgi:hypothetical protein